MSATVFEQRNIGGQISRHRFFNSIDDGIVSLDTLKSSQV